MVADESKKCNAKLCLIIMTCIAEDQYANSLMHDANMNFRVLLHKMVSRSIFLNHIELKLSKC